MKKDELKSRLSHAFFPRKCSSCHKIIAHNMLLCEECVDDIKVPCGARCKTCFNILEFCNCRKMPKFFALTTAPFVYDGSMKNIIISLKRIGDERLTRFLAEEMVKSIKKATDTEKIDAVIAVPMHRLKLLTRWFNQSELLACDVAKMLNKPLLSGKLKQKRMAKSQHTLKFDERKMNVKNIYKCAKLDEEYQTILLIDDVITSGSTTNECAKMLRMAGAKRIICLSATKTG